MHLPSRAFPVISKSLRPGSVSNSHTTVSSRLLSPACPLPSARSMRPTRLSMLKTLAGQPGYDTLLRIQAGVHLFLSFSVRAVATYSNVSELPITLRKHAAARTFLSSSRGHCTSAGAAPRRAPFAAEHSVMADLGEEGKAFRLTPVFSALLPPSRERNVIIEGAVKGRSPLKGAPGTAERQPGFSNWLQFLQITNAGETSQKSGRICERMSGGVVVESQSQRCTSTRQL
jgi:hypothetical protein